jgi:hypothetical protein
LKRYSIASIGQGQRKSSCSSMQSRDSGRRDPKLRRLFRDIPVRIFEYNMGLLVSVA